MTTFRSTANLTAGEKAVLEWVRVLKPHYGMGRDIARRLNLKRPWVCQILQQLVKSGHIRRIARGRYEINNEVV